MTNPNDPIVTAALAGGTVERSSDAADMGPPTACPYTVRLFTPIETLAGETISEIRLRVLTVGDRLAIRERNPSQDEEMLMYVARCSGLSPTDIKKMDAWDYEDLCRKVVGFMDPNSRPWETQNPVTM